MLLNIFTIRNVMEKLLLIKNALLIKVVIDDTIKTAIDEYYKQYGAK